MSVPKLIDQLPEGVVRVAVLSSSPKAYKEIPTAKYLSGEVPLANVHGVLEEVRLSLSFL